nr:SRPBCC family protein [uncultured Friedmanniella sp.]
MSLRLRVSTWTTADPATVWSELTDWAGQSRWIPLTTVQVDTPHSEGLGVRAVALSGFWLGRVPVGLLDRFVVTGWTPPAGTAAGELEVLHLGPYFTGEGAFRVQAEGAGTEITATEVFQLPGGRLPERLVQLALPAMRVGFRASLVALARLCESTSTGVRPR